jgi:hypothetical protein
MSLRTLEKNYRVYYDSTKNGKNFICKTPKWVVIFKRCDRTGFPYIELYDESSDSAVVLVQFVRDNYKEYTQREVEQAILACKLHARADQPSEKMFRKEVVARVPFPCSTPLL